MREYIYFWFFAKPYCIFNAVKRQENWKLYLLLVESSVIIFWTTGWIVSSKSKVIIEHFYWLNAFNNEYIYNIIGIIFIQW